jgi:hypothetical protein
LGAPPFEAIIDLAPRLGVDRVQHHIDVMVLLLIVPFSGGASTSYNG